MIPLFFTRASSLAFVIESFTKEFPLRLSVKALAPASSTFPSVADISP